MVDSGLIDPTTISGPVPPAFPLSQNNLEKVMEYKHNEFGQLSTVARIDLPRGSHFCYITTQAPVPESSWSSIQTSKTDHIKLTSGLVYMNHSCAATIEVQTYLLDSNGEYPDGRAGELRVEWSRKQGQLSPSYTPVNIASIRELTNKVYSIETLPLEIQEQILEYILPSGPNVNIIIRDASTLEEENHFNVLPKNPPHPFARYVCSPKHKPALPAIRCRRECQNRKYKIVNKTGKGTYMYALSLIYQMSPIPINMLCVSKNIQRAVDSIWQRYRRHTKALLDSHIVLKERQNSRYCGSYEMIWFSDFVENPSDEMLELCRTRCRFILDLDTSVFATLSTMTTPIARNIRNIVVPSNMVLDTSWFGTLLGPIDSVGVIMGDQKEVPQWCLELFDGRYVDKVECLRSRRNLATAVNKVVNIPSNVKDNRKERLVYTIPDTPAVEVTPPDFTSQYSQYRLPVNRLSSSEVHDRGRYIFNAFRLGDDYYYQGRETVEEIVEFIET
ncbi:hypothetical protein H072_3119 [Dactylellina haptotyla CBS 200.50]|uniref:Uncharacterized protein n=1 Tax=Dactylellina haptotyla (strain CBS 200.50) TaxID=1284197 RepID=S8AIR4_DACHA|nr:hypothetical protein H072_3119 [Dactylellina haptotyla CBS 200.50]